MGGWNGEYGQRWVKVDWVITPREITAWYMVGWGEGGQACTTDSYLEQSVPSSHTKSGKETPAPDPSWRLPALLVSFWRVSPGTPAFPPRFPDSTLGLIWPF